MNRVAIAFSSKDRVELTERTIQPLLQPDKFELFWCDGSKTSNGQEFFEKFDATGINKHAVYGGSCRYIVYALTTLLAHPKQYTHIGLVENDVLLYDDWFDQMMGLFHHLLLAVGAVSARCYEDRILIQRDGYAIMHNLGAGMIMFTRKAAQIILQHYRTHFTTENRRMFAILSGIDIGRYWAFGGSEHMLVADWGYDRQLAEHGLCSLALTPAKATQLENIAAMGLKMANAPVEGMRNEDAYKRYTENLHDIRYGHLEVPVQPSRGLCYSDGTHVTFPHQVPTLGGQYVGDWRFRWSLAYGCFAWQAGEISIQDAEARNFPNVEIPLFGPCELLVSGGQYGGRVRVDDAHSGFWCEPELIPEGQGDVFKIAVPGGYAYRLVRLTMLTTGSVFYGVRTREAQPFDPKVKFDFNALPPL